jgi:hypothetical protein
MEPPEWKGVLSISPRFPGRKKYVDLGREYVYNTLNVLNTHKIGIIIIIIIIIIINIRKCKSLAIEIKRIWNVKTKEIPVATGAT